MNRGQMDARQLFVDARDAIAKMAEFDSEREKRMSRAMSMAKSDGPHGKGGKADPMSSVDSALDFEASFAQSIEGYRRTVGIARSVVAGYSTVDRTGASVLALRYLMGWTWRKVYTKMGMSYDDVRLSESVAFDRIDSEGLIATAEGRLDVTGAE